MCGIFGFWGNSPLSRNRIKTVNSVALSQMARGRDAFGVAWHTVDGCTESFKRAGCIGDHIGELGRALDANCLIGHTRWTTHGSAERNDNNHPHEFMYRDRKCWLVHNGVICNYRGMALSNGLELRTECDSEVIGRFIEGANGTLIERVRMCVSEVDSSAPFAVAILAPDGLLIARRGNPVFWSHAKTHNWFASTYHALPGKSYEVPNNMAYWIPFRGNSVVKAELPKQTASSTRWLGSNLFA